MGWEQVDLPSTLICAFLFAGATLATVWCGFGRAHWFVRAMTAVVAAWLLVPTGAFSVIAFWILLVMWMMCARGCWQLINREQKLSTLRRFSLRDVALALVPVAGVLGIASAAARAEDSLLDSTSLHVSVGALPVILATIWLAFGESRTRLRFGAWLTGIGVLTAAWHYECTAPYSWVSFVTRRWDAEWEWFGAEAPVGNSLLFAAASSVMLLAAACTLHAIRDTSSSTPRRVLAGTALAVAATTFLGLSGFFCARLVVRVTLPPATMPTPNGFALLVEAGSLLDEVTVPDPDKDSMATIAQFLSSHQETLQLARKGSAMRCRVPVEIGLDWSERESEFFSGARQAARAFRVEARSRRHAGDLSAAADSSVDGTRFANAWSRGGMLVQHSTAFAFEGLAMRELDGVRAALDASDAIRTARQLAAVDEDREPLADILRRGKAWELASYGWIYRFPVAMDELLSRPPTWREELFGEAYRRRDAVLRLMIVELAARAYELKQQSPLDSLDELIPDYLARVPDDPYTGRPITLRLVDGVPRAVCASQEGDVVLRFTDSYESLQLLQPQASPTSEQDDEGPARSHSTADGPMQ